MSSVDEIEARLRRIAAVELRIPHETVLSFARLDDDANFDSMCTLQFILAVESAFAIQFNENELDLGTIMDFRRLAQVIFVYRDQAGS